jgi:outer membrane protein
MNKFLIRLFAGALLLSLLSGSAWAQGRVGTVDLRKVFDNYWKKKQAEAQLKERGADMEKELKNLLTDYKAGGEEYQTMLNGLTDQAVSPEELAKRKKEADVKLRAMQELQNNIRQYENTAKTTIAEQTDRMRANILSDIRAVVNAKAKEASFSMVLDTAAETINKTPVFLYMNSTENDITEAVLLQLNKNAPTDVPKTEEKPAPAPEEKKKDGKK